MGCEALLCLIKPFLIALLFCLLSKASELSSPSSNPVSSLFRKGGKPFLVSQTQTILFQNLFKQVIHRHCSLCHPHPPGQVRAGTP